MSRNPGTDRGLTSPALVPDPGLAAVNIPLRRREALLAASAKVSRLLLEAPEPMRVMPEALRLLGEAAEVDRTTLALSEVGPQDERWLVIKSEWLAEGVVPSECGSSPEKWDERKSDCFCPQLKAGRTVFVRPDESESAHGVSIAADRAKSSVIVPILVAGEYAGAIGFDDCHEPREFGSAVVSALEIAAGIIGAALHRERLMETMRREREQAAEARVAELAQRQRRDPRQSRAARRAVRTWKNFIEHVLARGHASARRGERQRSSCSNRRGHEWHVAAHVVDGRLDEPTFADVRSDGEVNVGQMLAGSTRSDRLSRTRQFDEFDWPGVAEFHRATGHQGALRACPWCSAIAP